MTYETRIGIDIAGIRRGVRIVFDYHVEIADGKRRIIYDTVTVVADKGRIPADWFDPLLGPRQRRELESDLLKHWENRIAA